MKECTAKVIKVNGNEIMLDQSNFFAFSGGQASDKGTINDIPVNEAVKSGDEIKYVLESEPKFSEGDEVSVKIDWETRFKIMRLHSAAHIVFYFFFELAGEKKVIGSNISIDKARLDFLMDEPVSQFLPELEKKTNDFIREGHEIKAYPDEDDPGKRIWECVEWKMPCGGTHLKNTDEIGTIRLKRKNIGAGKERIEVKLEE